MLDCAQVFGALDDPEIPSHSDLQHPVSSSGSASNPVARGSVPSSTPAADDSAHATPSAASAASAHDGTSTSTVADSFDAHALQVLEDGFPVFLILMTSRCLCARRATVELRLRRV
jgi:hypothetical protein